MKKNQVIVGCCLGLMVGASAFNFVNNDKSSIYIASVGKVKEVMVMDSKTFVQKAAEGGMLEVELGKLASKNAKDTEVKSFAQHMVTDHTKANEDLKKIAKKKNLMVPASLTEAKMKDVENLKKKTGYDFDKAFMQQMVDAHKKDMDLFDKASKELTDPELKSFATTTLKTIKSHYEKAKTLENKVSATSSTKGMKEQSEMEKESAPVNNY